MEEHPLFEQGDACPAIRLPLQQFEAMDKAFRWPVAPRQSEPCLYGRLLFVQIACKCPQFRLAMLLHFFQPPPQPISLALTQHMTKASTWPAVRASDSSAWISRAHRMLNELYFRLKHLGRLVQHSRLSTDKGSDIFSFSKKRSDEECSQTGLLLR